MPELPEVQTVVNDLKCADLIGRVILKAQVYWPKIIATPPLQLFKRQISGSTIESIQRRAKLILFYFENGWGLAVHLRMTGRFQLEDGQHLPNRHVHAILELDDGRCLRYIDTRKFGRFYLTNDMNGLLAAYGPEPLDRSFTVAKLTQIVTQRHRQIKPLLLDQHCIAGLGNIYADEALWEARIHPMRPSDTLSGQDIEKLYKAIRKVLRQGIKHAGTTLGNGQSNFYSLGRSRGRNENSLQVFRRTAQPCKRCNTPIARIMVGQRSSHICEKCQPL